MNKEAVRRENCKTVLKMTSIRLKRLFAEDFFLDKWHHIPSWSTKLCSHKDSVHDEHVEVSYVLQSFYRLPTPAPYVCH
jgi:hypothetical protein